MIDQLEELLARVAEEASEEAVLPELTAVGGLIPVGTVDGTGKTAPLYKQAAGEREELSALTAAEGLPPLMDVLTHQSDGSGLSSLYRQVAREAEAEQSASRPGGAMTGEEAPAVSSGLTAGELDRMLRRDSRRYDGGMTIY